ncbi:WbqC family protein [Streptosporangium sp. NPDC006007]|uniref:WbqC family protein n=1 Tax=Streptosporangium sp. NPDC006007 TaxID=3154575 RepID=UPI0033AC2695
MLTTATPDRLGRPRPIHRSSDLGARAGRSDRLANLTCTVGATTYLCGTGGAWYLDPWPFATHGLATELFTVPEYGAPRIWRGSRSTTARGGRRRSSARSGYRRSIGDMDGAGAGGGRDLPISQDRRREP